ncbi:MAG: protein-L-isoaspartate(D-aspartate) O-methyltransferase [Candidatus Aminicenantes bacterium]|nr:MAG: protein-L-isoaspartate(D-aspartate) O-methyltransferase [Candidatus Aminicenantes bacterium]
MKDVYERERRLMVENQIRARGVTDQKVLDAMLKVPRHLFVPHFEQSSSYSDGPLPIGHGQTISQPYIVAYMTELLDLQGDEKVLELGTGCGYQTAVLAEIAKEVYTIEIIEALGKGAQELLTRVFNYTNIFFKFANGREGWLEYAPFERILLAAAPTRFPQNLFDQLAEGGIAVAPVGDYFQRLVKYWKKGGKIKSDSLIGVSFVPFV